MLIFTSLLCQLLVIHRMFIPGSQIYLLGITANLPLLSVSSIVKPPYLNPTTFLVVLKEQLHSTGVHGVGHHVGSVPLNVVRVLPHPENLDEH